MQSAHPSLASPTVLIVDDDLGSSAICADILREAGYSVLVADQGARALELAAQRPPDLIVTDLYMPCVDGEQLIRSLRRLGVACPVVMMSGTSMGMVKAFQARADAYLDKPFEASELLRVAAQLLSSRTA